MPAAGKLGVRVIAGVVLVAGLLMQLRPPVGREGQGPPLTRAIPADIPGWRSQPQPLGPTEAAEGEVAKVLQFDEVVYREYSGPGGAVFSVYAAYWRPGKVPAELVAAHTPDICWIGSGWSFGPDGAGEIDVPVSGGPALRVQERHFVAGIGGSRQVWFWHLSGGESLDDRELRSMRPVIVWRNLWRRAAAPGEQYFVRVSSSGPLGRLAGDLGWEQMLAALARLGRPVAGTGTARP